MELLGILASIGAGLGSIWLLLKYVIVYTYKLDISDIKNILNFIQTTKGIKFILNEQYVRPHKYAQEYSIVCKLEKMPIFFFKTEEKLLTAGWQSKEQIAYLKFARWNKSQINNWLNETYLSKKDESGVPVYITSPGSDRKIGELIFANMNTPDFHFLPDLEKDIQRTIIDESKKLGILLHGPPGNGKTFLIKYLATKFSLPIKILHFDLNYSNEDIIYMFSYLEPKSIVVMEDFDNYFDNRKCLLGGGNNINGPGSQVKFTFDSILNGLDGIYSSYKSTIFIMTTNNLDKIDPALKNRPSRFKHVYEITPPSNQTVNSLLDGVVDNPEQHYGKSLDEIYNIKDIHSR